MKKDLAETYIIELQYLTKKAELLYAMDDVYSLIDCLTLITCGCADLRDALRDV
jgi:hypothetical protein